MQSSRVIDNEVLTALTIMLNYKSEGMAFPSGFLDSLDTLLNPINPFPDNFLDQLEGFLCSVSVTPSAVSWPKFLLGSLQLNLRVRSREEGVREPEGERRRSE